MSLSRRDGAPSSAPSTSTATRGSGCAALGHKRLALITARLILYPRHLCRLLKNTCTTGSTRSGSGLLKNTCTTGSTRSGSGAPPSRYQVLRQPGAAGALSDCSLQRCLVAPACRLVLCCICSLQQQAPVGPSSQHSQLPSAAAARARAYWQLCKCRQSGRIMQPGKLDAVLTLHEVVLRPTG